MGMEVTFPLFLYYNNYKVLTLQKELDEEGEASHRSGLNETKRGDEEKEFNCI